jgi:hypothetical protein
MAPLPSEGGSFQGSVLKGEAQEGRRKEARAAERKRIEQLCSGHVRIAVSNLTSPGEFRIREVSKSAGGRERHHVRTDQMLVKKFIELS